VNLIHVLGSRQYGGADQFYVRLVNALHEAGHHIVAVNRPGSPVARALDRTGVAQHRLPLANQWDFVSVLRLRRLIARERPAVVQTYMGRATRLTRVPRASPARHIARLGGYYKLRGYYEHCDAWVGNTRGVCDYLVREGMPAARVFHIGNFVTGPRAFAEEERDGLRQMLALPEDAIVLLALGRFIGVKGFDTLILALAAMRTESHGRPVHLVLVGDGRLREPLQALAGETGVAGRVHWPGWHDDPEPFFAIADVLVCPSRHETLGNVILEGWSHALPVVATMTPGACELITDEGNGLLVPVGDPEALAFRIQALLNADDDSWRRLVDAGTLEILRHHAPDAVVAAYTALYERVAAMPRRHARIARRLMSSRAG